MSKNDDGGRIVRPGTIVIALPFALAALGATGWWDASSTSAVAQVNSIVVARVSGVVFLRTPAQQTFTSLKGQRRVPAGTEVDVADGEVALRLSNGEQGNFYDGRFVIALPPERPPTVELLLSGGSFKVCHHGRSLAVAEKPRPPRRLWGKAKGKFRTRGRYSVTSVRGTTWLTEDSCDGTLTRVTSGNVLVLDLLKDRVVQVGAGKSLLTKAPVEYSIPAEKSAPVSITTSPDGNLWFTENDAGNIGRSTPAGNIIEFAVPGDTGPGDDEASSAPEDIVAGPDGNLWFTDANSPSVGRITRDGQITKFAVSSTTHGITVGPDKQIWFTESDGKIGRISTTGVVQEFDFSSEFPGDAARITAGPDGNVWFSESLANKIGRVTVGGSLTEFDLPTSDATPFGITTGPDGAIWFTESSTDQIGRITPAGAIMEFPLPTKNSVPLEIVLSADRNLWFTEQFGNNLGKMMPSGRVTEIPVPEVSSLPSGLTVDLRGNVWFTEVSGNNIGCARC